MLFRSGDFGKEESAHASADDLVIENGAGAGMTIRSPAANTGNLMFARPGLWNVGGVIYRHPSETIALRAGSVDQLLLGPGTFQIPNLPTVRPAAGSKQIWADPDDGHRVKYQP